MKLNAKKFRVSSHYWPKREFNPNSKDDLAEYAYFLQKGTWRDGCPFIVEWPFLNVISMIEHRFISQHIGSKIKIATE